MPFGASNGTLQDRGMSCRGSPRSELLAADGQSVLRSKLCCGDRSEKGLCRSLEAAKGTPLEAICSRLQPQALFRLLRKHNWTAIPTDVRG